VKIRGSNGDEARRRTDHICQEREPNMAEKLDPKQVVTFEELLRAMMFETEATRRVLVQSWIKGREEEQP